MKTIGLIVAMDKEYNLVCEKLLEGKSTGMVGENRVIVRKGGIGKVNAAVATMDIIQEFKPDVILNSGIAGAVNHRAGRGDVVIAEKIAYHDVWCGEGVPWGQVQDLPMYFTCNEDLIQRASHAAQQSAVQIHTGLICSGDRFITGSDQDKKDLGRFPEVLAVDMESGAISQVCYLKKVPFAAIRVISDVTEEEGQLFDYAKFFNDAATESFSILKTMLKEM